MRMSQGDLADRLGVTPVYVSRVLRGKDGLGLHSLIKIADALKAEVIVSLAPVNALAGEIDPYEY